ncbi:MAG: hypothetical protein ACNS60_13935 [Candidatus Cyclobacteriaceae bacterium M2_1C_046]
MNKLIILLGIILPGILYGQTEYKKSIPLDGAQKISMSFKWPEVITVKYHDKQEVLIEGNVSINYGKYDERFKITHSGDENQLTIVSEVMDMESIEQITIVREKDGKNQVVGNNYTVISGDGEETVSKGITIDIFLTVYLPKGTPVKIEAKFGLIEIKETGGPLIANSKFGGVDLFVDQKKNIDLKAGTVFGEIFTDLAIDFRGNGELENIGKWHRITSTFGKGGTQIDVESKFGNIYLRQVE